MVYRRVSLGMLHQDKVLLALLLMRIVLKSNTSERSYQLEVSFYLLLIIINSFMSYIFLTFII